MLKTFVTLAGGEVVARGLQAIAMVLLTRAVGMGPIGQFGVASSIAAYAVLLVSQGFDTIAIRAAAQRAIQVGDAVRDIMGLRLLLALAVTAVTVTLAWGRREDPVAQLLLILCATFFSSAMTPRWVFLAEARSRPLALAGVISQGCFLAGVCAVHSAHQLYIAACSLAGGEVAATLFLWIVSERPMPRWNWHFSRWLFAESWPVSLSMVLGTAFFNFDLLALAAYGRRIEVGPYLSSYRCVAAFSPLLAALQNSILPRFAASWPDFGAIRRKIAFLSAATSSVLGAAAVVLFVFATPVLHLLYGSEIGAAPVTLRVLIWALPLQGSRAVIRQALLGFKRQDINAKVVTAGLLTNIALDLLLIPSWGALGCAYSTLASEVVFLAGMGTGLLKERAKWLRSVSSSHH